ncbi:tRNA (5-methylaminomethyl-2-thiouridine)(34)-methyltransferase MnmD [uncultured Bacteroides sp.]|uniref:tRNA (5-methylaminomethyl-2-thiouridine)(34)-methyltransferase MnmD n=1 Tax=uncultured Bacteroides sp. TaxID=162156 RepID=UPI0025D51884|nr:tRNA (5-methylaminomethyl-2-thiouridine)(34)-methyltransferase MnmD [uncultured Bacteroides sp.]
MERIIEKTEDGSATLFVPELNEHYHSTKGARTESQHIFIDMGLKASAAISPHVLEIGFGTGLNAWLTLKEAEKSGRNVHYTGLELYPLEWQTVEQLNYIPNDEQLTVNGEQQPAVELFKQLHTSPWEEEVRLTPHFTLRKVQADVKRCLIDNGEWRIENDAHKIHSESAAHYPLSIINYPLNIVYFDAFAPEKQPEMWSQELFNRLYVLLAKDGILTTYCAKGIVRRMLQTAGFIVERLPGPPGGKREILRARKQE